MNDPAQFSVITGANWTAALIASRKHRINASQALRARIVQIGANPSKISSAKIKIKTP